MRERVSAYRGPIVGRSAIGAGGSLVLALEESSPTTLASVHLYAESGTVEWIARIARAQDLRAASAAFAAAAVALAEAQAAPVEVAS